MKLRFWGVRGSVPAPMNVNQLKKKMAAMLEIAVKEDLSSPEKIKDFVERICNSDLCFVGGNSPCVDLKVNNTQIIFDMGTGMRELGQYMIKHALNPEDYNLHVFMSHSHWDHIHGFPFFIPAYNPKTNFYFYSPHDRFKERLEAQQDFRFFPVPFEVMASKKNFRQLNSGETITINDIKISNIELHHPGKSFGYKVEFDGKSIVYATDASYNNLSSNDLRKYVQFYKNADLLIFDAQFSFDEEIQKFDWGHSSALFGIDLSLKAGVKKLALFHHAPEKDDFEINRLLKTAIEYQNKNYPGENLEVFLARENLTIEI